MANTKRIVIVDMEGLMLDHHPITAQLLTIEVNNDVDIKQAIKLAAKDYITTNAGKNLMSETHGTYNWGDLALYHNADICLRYGFLIKNVEDISDIYDLNENLAHTSLY